MCGAETGWDAVRVQLPSKHFHRLGDLGVEVINVGEKKGSGSAGWKRSDVKVSFGRREM